MATQYVTNTELAFAVPSGWTEKTMVILQSDTVQGISVVFTRETLGPGQNIRSFCDQQMVELAKRLSGFVLDSRNEMMLAQQPASDLRFNWASNEGLIRQRMVWVADKKRSVWTFTGTCLFKLAAEMESAVDSVIATLRWRE